MSFLESVISSLNFGNYPLVSVKSKVDGNYYRVRDLPDKQNAADLMARVYQKIHRFYNYLVATFPDKPQIIQLKQNFKPDPKRLSEATPDADHTSYSINKGEAVHLCLRQRNGPDESLVNENIMFFVALHEMGHMITKSIGHGPDFWNNFGWLLKQAEEQGYYKYQNFSAQPVSYCGVRITDEPKYDPQKDGAEFTIGSLT
jgi:hypothetical protein